MIRSLRWMAIAGLVCVTAVISATAAMGQTDIEHRTADGLPYLVTPPDGYAPDGGGVPVLLFLHGGDRSNTRHHPARYAAGEGIEFPFLVIAPHCTSGCSWARVDFDALLAEVDQAYSVDPSRIYLTGYSMGGIGSWDLLGKRPDLFAAAAPIAGGGDAGSICRARGVPIRAYHGDADDVISHSRSVVMIDALEACDGKGELITLPGVDHRSWIPTFKDPAFYAWLLSNRKADG